MQFSSLLLAACASCVIATSDTVKLTNAFNTINQKALILAGTVSSLKPGFQNALSAGVVNTLSQQQDLLNSINAATKTAKASAPLPQDDDFVPFVYSVGYLVGNVTSILDTFEGEYSTFKSYLIAVPIVENDLKSDRAASLKLVNATTVLLPANFQAIAPTIVQPIFDKFDEAIAVYSK